MRFSDLLDECTEFEWDSGNIDKNWKLHRVSKAEAEEPFFNRPVLIASDLKHSEGEARFALLGCTNAGRQLAIIFTVRANRVRIISARDMSRKERKYYERPRKER